LTDKRSVAAFNRFLDGAESIDKLRGELNNVEGELDRIREEQLNTTEGSIKLLTSAWEGLILSFSNSTGIFKDVVDWLTQIVTWLNKAKVAADDYGKTQTETSYYKQMIEDSRKDHEDTFTKSFTEHINEGYTSEKVYEIEKAQTTKFLNEIQEDFDNFMMRRQQSINMGINKEGEWSKADTDYYNNLKMKIDSTKVSLEALDDVYKKFKTPDPVKTIPTLAPEGKESAVKAALDQQLRDIDNFYKEKQLIIDLNEKGEWKTEEEHQNLLLQNERVHLDKRIETLKSFKTSYKKLSSEATAKLLEDKISQNKLNDKEDKKTLDSLKKKQTEMLKTIEQKRLDALEVLQQEETDQRVIALRTQEIEVNASQARLDVFNVFAQEIEKEELKNGLNRTKVIEQNGEDILDAEKKSLKDREKLRKTLLKTTLDFEKQYGIKTVQQEQSDELGSLRSLRFKKNAAGKFEEKDSDNEVLEKPAISDEQYQQAKTNLLKQYEDKRFQVRRQYGIDSMKELYNSEMDALKEQYELGYLTTEEYEKAKFQIKLKYAQEYAQKAGEFAGTLTNTVKSLEEAETAQVEAEYTERQAALTEQYNQGIISREEYDAQKEQLDYEQKVKELEVQKKYADVNFALQTSQIIASTALAAMQAYASMSGIPVVGSVLGAIAAAAAVVAGAAQIAKAKAERDKVKAMTIEAPGGGGDAAPTPTAARVLKPAGFAGGGYNDEDEEQSGYTGRGERYEVAGVFPNGQPYHRGEYIVATPELKDPAVMQYVRAIESVRRRRTNRNPLPEGFAEGGYNTYSGAPSAPTPADNAVFFEIRDFLRDLKSGVNIKAKASVSLTDLKAAQDLEAKATKIFTKTDKS
jgi:hypothetical protein